MRQGDIVAVNDAWRKFAVENDLPDYPNAGVGLNYLHTCQKSLVNANDMAAQKAMAGIQEVIQGVRKTFTMVYPCHSPAIRRWFRMEVGMAEPDGPFFLIVHQDITDLELAKEALLESERNFRMLADNVTDVIWAMDMNLKYTLYQPIGEEAARLYA